MVRPAVRSIVAAELLRLAGHDVTPGHDELHHYWTRGEGLAKWVHSPHPWTALYHHLVKYVNPEMAKRMASAWFHEVLGFWPGEKHVGAVRVPKGAGRSALIQSVVAAEVEELLRKFDPHQPRDPDGKWSIIGAAKKLAGLAKGKKNPADDLGDGPHFDFPPPPKPRSEIPHVQEMRREFKERLAGARKGDGVLDATPGKFSYDIKHNDNNTIEYKGRGRITGITGAGTPAALEAYQTTEAYSDINRSLRGQKRQFSTEEFGLKGYGHADFTPEEKAHADELVRDIDKTIGASKLTNDVVVHRVVESGQEIFGPVWTTGGDAQFTGDRTHDLQLLHMLAQWRAQGWNPDITGMKFTDPGYTSTSAHQEWPEKWATQWMDKRGAEPLMMRILVPKGTGGIQLSESGEAEILLQRGLSYEVVADHGVGPDGLRRIDLRVVDQS